MTASDSVPDSVPDSAPVRSALRIHVVSFSGDSGITDYAVSLCRALDALADVTLVTARSYDPARYQVAFRCHRVFRRTLLYPLDLLRFIAYTLREKPDVVLFQSWLKWPLLEAPLIALLRLAGIRTALTVHDLLPHDPRRWSRAFCAAFYRRFERLVVHSDRAAQGLREMGVTTAPLVVPHGIYDIFRLAPLTRADALRQLPQLDADDFTVLFFGHIDVRKGILEFLRASALLRHEPRIKFVVAGGRGGGMPAAVSAELDRYAGAPNVVLHDTQVPFERVQYYFTAAHAVALPYLEGTTSGVIKLAMAFDRPILATDIGDFAETLRDWSGIVLAGADPAAALAQAIVQMRDGYDSYVAELKANGAKYQWPHIAAAHLRYLAA
ncbi:glycosyltransferase family 4 protein [Rugamonas sp.]|uniref:glycosyltransferase family 4 protein n=1 Tax=Rugamonas sp. TaxID=1926287 RepID=UPI0025E2D2FB|nr:glycosyltransferase family 4 protein [Rugamonas sp.]